jgi:hypothetical protein
MLPPFDFVRDSLWQRRYVARRTDLLPASVRGILLEAHAARLGQTTPENRSPVALANGYLSTQAARLRTARIALAYSEEAIREHAENYARLCARFLSLERRERWALTHGVQPPRGRRVTTDGAIKRLDDSRWWRRQLRAVWTRSAECALREFGLIRRGREPYASNEAVYHRAAQRRRGRDFLEACQAVNELGEAISLAYLAERSLANPALRRGELMCRVRGFEEFARAHGHVGVFVTFTAPSIFHPQLAAGGANPHYQAGLTVRDAQAWLCRMWSRVRARVGHAIAMRSWRSAVPCGLRTTRMKRAQLSTV